jgi:hypothetical protein
LKEKEEEEEDRRCGTTMMMMGVAYLATFSRKELLAARGRKVVLPPLLLQTTTSSRTTRGAVRSVLWPVRATRIDFALAGTAEEPTTYRPTAHIAVQLTKRKGNHQSRRGFLN